MSADTLGMVVIADGVTIHLARDLAWLAGLLLLAGVGTCLFALAGWWHDVKDALRRRVA